MDDDDPLRRR
jgi:hypothetical protein